jgi:nicotinamide-nucleotide amidase
VSNYKQADFPRGSTVLDNDHGTAPGFFVDIGSEGHTCRAFFLPGVPSEMEPMFEAGVVRALPRVRARLHVRRLRVFGMPESEVNDLLAGLEQGCGVTIGYRASGAEIEVKVLSAERAGELYGGAATRADAALGEARARLGEVVFGDGTMRLPEHVGALLLERGLTLGLAESCTGGLVSHLLTTLPGASAYYLGGVCCYGNSVKQAVLGVSAASLDEHGAVSAEVARELAEGARRLLGVDVALALTGVAGPSGGTHDKPVGLVHWAVADRAGTLVEHRCFPGGRAQVQRRAALAGLWSVRQRVLSA